MGQVLAFDGGLQHRGEPITRGKRYIIAAFLFVENSSVEMGARAEPVPCDAGAAAAPPVKRSFADTIGLSVHSDSQEPKRAAFSFNFVE